jgi:FtsP/CotA-like multicopper oxidase with cupredoxin domain
MRKSCHTWLPLFLVCLLAVTATAQSFRVQCPATTTLHPAPPSGEVDLLSGDPLYTGPSPIAATLTPQNGGAPFPLTYITNGGAIKCQEISGGDGFMTEADGHQTYLFGFGPLSGLGLIQSGLPGTQLAADFNQRYNQQYLDLALTKPDPTYDPALPLNSNGSITQPAEMMNVGVLNANIPAPTMAIDEDDEFFLTLSNVGMIMRPDLFEQHTVHFHGYPNASSFYDGVPDASIAINIGGSFTYYYFAPDAGTYFWHCHITPPEHLQMGMVGQLYVRPRQNRLPLNASLAASWNTQQLDLRTSCNVNADILCATPKPLANTATQVVAPFAGVDPRIPTGTPSKYAYNDGDGTTRYDVELPLQIHGFDPNFHFVGMTFNPEGFADMKDKYFLLNGRSYPDTVDGSNLKGLNTSYLTTEASDAVSRPSQPLAASMMLIKGEKALVRISDLDVTEYQTLASLGIPMQVIALNARILRDQAGNNLYYQTNSITLAGGESLDVILDTSKVATGTYFLFTPQVDHLSNDAENFGGLMTEIQVCTAITNGICIP